MSWWCQIFNPTAVFLLASIGRRGRKSSRDLAKPRIAVNFSEFFAKLLTNFAGRAAKPRFLRQFRHF